MVIQVVYASSKGVLVVTEGVPVAPVEVLELHVVLNVTEEVVFVH